jgi:flagellar protein FlaI
MKKEGGSSSSILLDTSPEIPAVPRVEDKTRINARYSLVSPFSNAFIHWDEELSEVNYNVEEPLLSDEEKKNKDTIKEAMLDIINLNSVVSKDENSLLEYIDKTFKLLLDELNIRLSEESYSKIYYYLYRDFIGYDRADPLLKDYFIEDIECNGINTPLYVVHRIFRNIRTNVVFDNIEELANFVEKLAQRCGKHISYAQPILDGTLPDGSRVNATYSKDISSRGPTFTIRKFTKVPFTPVKLIELNTLSPETLAYLWMLIQYKMNILIVGGTASGKTTLLNAVAFFIPPEARVVSIEDTRELELSRENWLPSVSRTSVGMGGLGEVDLFSLLKSSFRQNPDYVIVGEVRGKEAYVLFQGMASGHSSLSTIHGDSVDTVIKRLETPPIELSPTLLNVLDSVCIMTHAIVKKKETRKLQKIVELVNVSPQGVAQTNTLMAWNPRDDKFYFKSDSRVFQKIANRYGLTIKELNDEFRKRSILLYSMLKQGVQGFEDVQKIINLYYKNPEKVLQQFNVK